MNRLDVGDSVRLVATFKDFAGVARDPAGSNTRALLTTCLGGPYPGARSRW